ncbi:hypothetical protein STCU_12298 [Strigomonas culicis]|uniref:Uncharacterized protein n=1 Tax=Strigomonas culicis TaxID=28005 RepID=S9TB05_9TRYP|nr:hypothetical protein STCU_12298 [Strigomonas culicis]|eukprot:EPY15162.1 hypothetical protein STCU_12298 [Strigomonas culicis]
MGEIERIARRQRHGSAHGATVEMQAVPNHQWPQVGHPIINKHVPLIPLHIFKVLTRRRPGAAKDGAGAAAAGWDVDLTINDIFAGMHLIASAKGHGFLRDDTTDEYMGDDSSQYLSNEYKLLRTEKVDTKDNQGKKHRHKKRQQRLRKKLLRAQGSEADETDASTDDDEDEDDHRPYRCVYAEALRYTLSTARFRRLHLGSHHRAIRNNGQTRRARLPGARHRAPGDAGEDDAAAAEADEQEQESDRSRHFDHTDATLPPANKILAAFTGCLLEIQEQEAAKVLDLYLGKRDRREIMHLFLLRNLFLHKYEFHDLESFSARHAAGDRGTEKEALTVEDPLLGEDLCETFARHYEQSRLERCLLDDGNDAGAHLEADFNLTDVIFSVHENYTHFYLIPELCYDEAENDLHEAARPRGGGHHHSDPHARFHQRGRIGLVIADGIRTLIIVAQQKQSEDERSRTEAAYYYNQARQNESYYHTNNNNQTGAFVNYL